MSFLSDALKGAAKGFLSNPAGGWVSAGVGALGGVLSDDPARQGDRAAQEGIDERTQFLRENRDLAMGLTRPYAQGGSQAFDRLLGMAGLLGEGAASQWQTDPGYLFRLSEGQKALDRRSSAGGHYFSGGALKEASRYGQEFASNEFNNIFNRLGNIASVGQAAVAGQANVLMGTAGGIGAGLAASGFQRQSAYDRKAAEEESLFGMGMDFVKDRWGGGSGYGDILDPNTQVGDVIGIPGWES